MNADERERQQIRDAMGRLLAGQPIRSDGKLTIKSLAAEAGLKRGKLTHKHTDLQTEFRDRILVHGATPDALQALTAENADLKRRLSRARADRKRVLDRARLYVRKMYVLEIDNAQLEARLREFEPRLSLIDPRTTRPPGR